MTSGIWTCLVLLLISVALFYIARYSYKIFKEDNFEEGLLIAAIVGFVMFIFTMCVLVELGDELFGTPDGKEKTIYIPANEKVRYFFESAPEVHYRL